MRDMDPKAAVKVYQFGERAKSELIICSQVTMALAGFPDTEQAGGRRMLLLILDAVRAETEFALRSTGMSDFRKASDRLSEAISSLESNNYGAASQKMGEAISAATTAAQAAFDILSSHELL